MFKIHSFFPFFNQFLSFLTLSFAAGAVSLGGGGESSVLDAVGAGDISEGESGADEGGGEAGGEIHEADGAEGGADVAEEAAGAQPAVKAKPGMTPEIAKALEALNATAPKVAKEIKAKLYAGAQAEKALFGLKKDFPGGVADVLALKTAIDTQLGGVEQLEQLGQDLQSWNAIDKKWDAKDPSLASDLAKEYPEQFAGMVPHFVNKFAELNPPAYSKMYAGMVVAEVQGQNIPQGLHLLSEYHDMLAQYVPDGIAKQILAKAVAIGTNMNKWVGDLNKIATTPVPAKGADTGTGEIDKRQSALDVREKQQFNREVSTDYNSYRDSLITKQLDELLTANKKTLTPERREVVIERAMKKLSAQMNANPDFRKTVERYEKAKDGAGLIKFLKSRAGEAMKGANGKTGLVAKAYQELFGEASLGAKKKDDAGAPAVNPGAGWLKVAKPPKASEISRARTEAEGRKSGLSYEQMIMKNKYVLHDGKKVFHD